MILRNIKTDDYYKNYIELANELSKNKIKDKGFLFFKDIIEKIKDNPYHFIFVIENNNKIIGTITVLIEQKIIRNFGKVCHIEDLIIKKEFRNKKLSSKLINHCIEFSKKNNCYKIILNCENNLINYYKKYGFINKNQEMCIYL